MSTPESGAFDEDDGAATRLLGILPSSSRTEETVFSHTKSLRPTRVLSTASRTRASATASARDRADDELNEMLNAKHAGLETKWIILIVAVLLLLFTAMATAAFVLRRFHRGRVLERKRRDEQLAKEETELANDRRQADDDDPYHMEDRQPYAVI